jgi:Gnt-I system high-affinity gluconate transporter
MALLTVFLCIILLVLLVTWAKLNPFLAFLVVSIVAGLLLGMPLNKVSGSVQKGLGDTLGSLAVIICLGAMLGKLIAFSGAAQKITEVLVKAIGLKHIQWALMVAGFIIGIPLFYGIGFVLVVPLIFAITYKYKLPVIYIGLPMLAALSVTHGFLPPHPSPSALVVLFNANMGLTLIYGLVIAIPTIIRCHAPRWQLLWLMRYPPNCYPVALTAFLPRYYQLYCLWPVRFFFSSAQTKVIFIN